jgi:hypothetical protein
MRARSASQTFDLRCEVREKLIAFLQKEHPEALPHSRQISLKGSGTSGDEVSSVAEEARKRIRPA